MFTGQAEPTQWSLVKPLPEWLLEGRRASECQSTPHAGVSFANSCEANILWRLWWYIMVQHGWFVALWFVSLHNYTQNPILATSYAHCNPVSFLTVTCRECRARHFLQEVALCIYIYPCIEFGRLGCACIIFKCSMNAIILAQVNLNQNSIHCCFFPHPPNPKSRPPVEMSA